MRYRHGGPVSWGRSHWQRHQPDPTDHSMESFGQMQFAVNTIQVPSNCYFLVDDAEKPWEDPKTYHLIHIRYMEGAFTDWPRIFQQAKMVLKPGGIIEVHGLVFQPFAQQGEIPEAIQDWSRELYKLTRERGTPIDVTSEYETWMQEAGFVEIQKHTLSLPLGRWPKSQRHKEMGALNLAATIEEIESYSMKPFVEAGWSEEEATVLIAQVRHAYLENCGKNQLYTKVVIVTARKPRGD